MKKETGSTSQERQFKFAEAGILIALVAALTIFVGVKVSSHGGADVAADSPTPAEVIDTAAVEVDTASVAAEATALATAAETAGQTEAALPAADIVARTERAPVAYAEAEKVFFAGNYEEAAALFSDYTDEHGENAWGFYMLGLSERKAGDPDAAEDAFRRALDLKPDHLKSLVNYARVLIDLDRNAEAQTQIEMALAVNPNSLDAVRVQGRIQHNLGELGAAASSYRTVLAGQPDDVWALNNLGLILIEQEQFAEALAPLAKATLIRGDVACIQNNLGIALERTGHFTAAGEAYAQALQVDPAYGKALASRTRVGELTGSESVEEIDLAALAAGFQARPGSPDLEADMEVASAPAVSAPEIDEPVTDGSRNR